MHAVSEQAAAADALVHEALENGLSGSHSVTLQAKMLRLELLNVKADLERESDVSYSTARPADEGCTGFLVLALSPDIGRTGSRRHTTNPLSSHHHPVDLSAHPARPAGGGSGDNRRGHSGE